MNCNLKIALAIILFFNFTQTVLGCPNWESDNVYNEGDKISFEGINYEAVRVIPINTPPIVSDNGWFWVETNDSCNEIITSEANSFEVLIDNEANSERTVKMDSSGISVRKRKYSGGGTSSKMGYDYISVHAGGPKGATNCTIKSSSVTLLQTLVGPKPDYTTITSNSVRTSGTIETESNVKCNDLILRNVSLVQKILELESRLADLENK